jgi:uncharacterized protein YndB with AHSA1/START domain
MIVDPSASNTTSSSIHWPSQFSPERAPVHVYNELSSSAPPAAVWACLVRASSWPEWYSNSREVRLPDGAKDLEPEMTFRWQTFGVRLVSQVKEFVPHERLAWDARSRGVLAYHAWLIRPTHRGCTIITEETQYGVLARLGHLLMPQRMHRGHQHWLEQLDRLASGGMPT